MSGAEEIRKRLEDLRLVMAVHGAQWYLMVTTDPHASEYINDCYKEREFFSGFTGSNGTLLVGTAVILCRRKRNWKEPGSL